MSTVKANDLMKVDGGIPTVKGQKLIPTAWVNFNGTSTVAIRDSENVSSITDVTTGRYTIHYTTAMSNSNYCAQASCDGLYNGGNISFGLGDSDNTSVTASSISVDTRGNGSTTSRIDAHTVYITIFGGQA